MSTVPNPRANPELIDRLVELDRAQGLRDAVNKATAKPTPIRYVECRTFGHIWLDIEADRNPAVGWYMRLRCERCGCERNDIINRYGVVERRSYKPAKDYRDTDSWKRADWRMQYIRRLSGGS